MEVNINETLQALKVNGITTSNSFRLPKSQKIGSYSQKIIQEQMKKAFALWVLSGGLGLLGITGYPGIILVII